MGVEPSRWSLGPSVSLSCVLLNYCITQPRAHTIYTTYLHTPNPQLKHSNRWLGNRKFAILRPLHLGAFGDPSRCECVFLQWLGNRKLATLRSLHLGAIGYPNRCECTFPSTAWQPKVRHTSSTPSGCHRLPQQMRVYLPFNGLATES